MPELTPATGPGRALTGRVRGLEMTVREQAEEAYQSMIDAGYGTTLAMRAYQTKMTTLPVMSIGGTAVRLLRPSSRWIHPRMAGEES
jgi:predicted transcriptional regulator